MSKVVAACAHEDFLRVVRTVTRASSAQAATTFDIQQQQQQ